MYSGFSPRTRVAVKSALASAWALSVGAGVSTLAPTVVVEELGPVWTVVFAALLAVSGTVAMLGVILNRYQWEWVSSWGATLSLAPYALTLWAVYGVTLDWSVVPQAFLVSSLVGFVVVRIIMCAAHAEKLRDAHTSEIAITDIIEGEGSEGE